MWLRRTIGVGQAGRPAAISEHRHRGPDTHPRTIGSLKAFDGAHGRGSGASRASDKRGSDSSSPRFRDGREDAGRRELAQLPDFRCVVARDKHSKAVVGFALGWTCALGQGWRNTIEPALAADTARAWLADCFEFALIAVNPDAQRCCTGGRLHDRLLAALPHKTAIMSTLQEDTAALRLFRKKGWKTLRSDLVYPEGGRPCLLMGLDMRRAQQGGPDGRPTIR